MKKLMVLLFAAVMAISNIHLNSAEASTMWGKVKVTSSMIGKVTILKDVYDYKIVSNKLKAYKNLKKGNEYGVYSYSKNFGGLYSIGGGVYVRTSNLIKYAVIPNSIEDQVLGFGNIKGNLTWQYNQYIGTKPDVNAKVFLIPINFDPSKFKKADLDLYASVGVAPKNSYLYYGKADGYGGYEIDNVRAGTYILVDSSANTTRNMDDPIDVKSLLVPRLGSSYPTFEMFNLTVNKYDYSIVQIIKDKTIIYSHDFGYTYI